LDIKNLKEYPGQAKRQHPTALPFNSTPGHYGSGKMKMKFIDKLEEDIATFLHSCNSKAWAVRSKTVINKGDVIPIVGDNTKVVKTVPFDDHLLADDQSDVWDYKEREDRYLGLIKRLDKCREDLNRIKDQDALLIDDADSQLERIRQMNTILSNYDKRPTDKYGYGGWKEEDISVGADLIELPNIKRVLKGHSVDSILKFANPI
jgi:hypothetical protein